MSSDIVIRVEGLYKQYGLPLMPMLRGAAARLQGRPAVEPRWSLRDINFEVKSGETLGIIGYNGAGKSTLLKVLARVTPPTRGSVEVRGRVFPMIELNAGMNMELTGRENVLLLGILMGMSRAEIRAKLPEIEDFCELGRWFDESVWKYSSGMLARLGFSVALNVDADILLVDEVLAVGDITFQRKSLDRMERMQQSGKTVLFVSHSIRQVERLCDRVLLLNEGRQVAIGKANEIVSQYYETANTRILEHYAANGEKHAIVQEKLQNAVIDILNVQLLGSGENPKNHFHTGDMVIIEVEYEAHQPVECPIIGFGINTVDALYVSGFANKGFESEMPLHGRGRFRCTIPRLPLLNGIYQLDVKIKHTNDSILGGGRGLAVFSVTVPGEVRLAVDYGLVMIEAEWGK